MEVLACGTIIITKLSKIEGMITGIKIDFEAILYNITYYDGDKFTNCMMNELEFDILNAEKITIGFRK